MNFTICLFFDDGKMIRIGDVNYCSYIEKKLILSNSNERILLEMKYGMWRYKNSILQKIFINNTNLDIENLLKYLFENYCRESFI